MPATPDQVNKRLNNILVTGATGNVGASVIDLLKNTPIGVTAAVIDPTKYTLRGAPIHAVRLDFHEPATFAPALRGIECIFLMRPPAISKVGPTLNRFITVAAELGVKHIVFLSVAGAETNKIVPHHRVEVHLAKAGVDHTILRPGFFANNLGDAYREDIRTDDRLFVPAGDGRVAFIDARDIAAVVAAIAQNPVEHVGRGYTLTGSAAYSFSDAAALLSRYLGKPITYVPASIVGYFRHLNQRGLPVPQILVQVMLHVGLRKGSAATIDPTLARLLQRDPLTLNDYIKANQHLWR
jgi:uncharacterized protein YbjT (DUF2867 family)